MSDPTPQQIPGVDWQNVTGNYAVVRLVPAHRNANGVGHPQVVSLPYEGGMMKVSQVFSTHDVLEDAQAALLHLVAGEW